MYKTTSLLPEGLFFRYELGNNVLIQSVHISTNKVLFKIRFVHFISKVVKHINFIDNLIKQNKGISF